MAKEKKTGSKSIEEESEDDELNMNPTMRIVVKSIRDRIQDQLRLQLLAKMAQTRRTRKIDLATAEELKDMTAE